MDPEKLSPQFKVFQATPKSMGGVSHHTVEAWAPEHADTEWANARPEERSTYAGSDVDPGHRPIGSFSWSHKTGEITGLHTDPEHRRQGVATSMLNEANRVAEDTRGVKPPKHSSFRTESGEGWARSLGVRLPRRNLSTD